MIWPLSKLVRMNKLPLQSQAKEYKGLLLGLAAAAGGAISLTPYKIATGITHTASVVLLMLIFAALYNTVISLPEIFARSRGKKRGYQLSVTLYVALAAALLTAMGNYSAGHTISLLNSAVTSLLVQMQVLFASLLAWLWLREQVGRGFIFGALLALFGLAVMRGLQADMPYAITGTLWGLLAAFSFGSMQVLTRRYVRYLAPLLFNTLRLWLAIVFLAMVPGTLQPALEASPTVMGLAALAAFGGPFLGRLALIYAARYVGAALVTLMGLAGPLFALVTEWWFLDSLPNRAEIIGGLLVMFGMGLAILWGYHQRQQRVPQA